MSETPIKAFTPDVKQGRIAMLHFLPKENQVTSTRNLLWKYVSALKENIELRFHNTLPLLGALSIFDPNLIPTSATELSSYGVESIRVLASHYCPEQHDRLLAEWNILKYHMKEKTIPADVKEEKSSESSPVSFLNKCVHYLWTINVLENIVQVLCCFSFLCISLKELQLKRRPSLRAPNVLTLLNRCF